MEAATTPSVTHDGSELALRLALDGLEAGRYLLVDADGIVVVVGDGVGALLGAEAPGAGASAGGVLGDIGTPLPFGVARCMPAAASGAVALEATFAPIGAGDAGAVRAELDRLAATLGAPAERPALRALLSGAAGRAAEAWTGDDREGTLVLLRRADDGAEPVAPAVIEIQPPADTPPEAIALLPLLEELRTLRVEVSELRERDAGMPPHERSSLDAELRLARADADTARQEAARLRDELTMLRDDVTTLGDELGEAVRAAVLLSEDARRDALAARSDAEAARAEVIRERERPADAGPAVRPERVAEIWREMLAANAGADARRVDAVRRAIVARGAPEHPLDRPPEPGFDDVATPLAQVSLDGRFLRLNAAFSAIVGYAEADFQKASWPSLLDRESYAAQCDRRRALIEGEVERVTLDASYLGGQGLLVVVRGHVELVRDGSGEPAHLLLVGEDRHTL